MPTDPWIKTRLAHRHDWTEGLATFTLDGEVPDFNAGQFLRMGIDVGEDKPLSRPYSVASAPGHPLEFYIVLVEGGALTTPLFQLPLGAELLVHPRAGGVFTLDWVQPAETLWLVATGTGLAPYIAMMRTEEPWQKFQRIVLIQGARYLHQIAYREELDAHAAAHPGQLVQVNLVTREEAEGAIRGRVTELLEDGRLEEAAGAALTPETSQVLLCGNPVMVQEMQSLLGDRGMIRNRKRAPGHVTVEKYW
ncbi:MAG: ferredoxin--NADP reductase [Alphaproteobacteria bacterium]|nr:ferredoxin--NADP reductase [Alphaproteobacteria bacterium]